MDTTTRHHYSIYLLRIEASPPMSEQTKNHIISLIHQKKIPQIQIILNEPHLDLLQGPPQTLNARSGPLVETLDIPPGHSDDHPSEGPAWWVVALIAGFNVLISEQISPGEVGKWVIIFGYITARSDCVVLVTWLGSFLWLVGFLLFLWWRRNRQNLCGVISIVLIARFGL